MVSTADAARIKRIFFSYADLKAREVIAARGRFVYYTTADTATSILKNRQIWMRSTTSMNDYMEVEHGFECLNTAYKAESGNSFNLAPRSLLSRSSRRPEELLQCLATWHSARYVHDVRFRTFS
jgi:hypothetical protein